MTLLDVGIGLTNAPAISPLVLDHKGHSRRLLVEGMPGYISRAIELPRQTPFFGWRLSQGRLKRDMFSHSVEEKFCPGANDARLCRQGGHRCRMGHFEFRTP